LAEEHTNTLDTAAGTFISSPSIADTISLDGDAVEKLAKLGAQATGVSLGSVGLPASVEGLPPQIPVAIKHGDRPEIVSVKSLAEEWRTYPEHRRGVAKVGDVQSFNALVNRQKTEHSVVFSDSDWRKPSLTAVIDYHSIDPAKQPDFGKHRVHYAFPFSDEWNVWLKHDGVVMDQEKFAEFVEERAPDMTTLVEAESAHFARELQVPRIGTPIEIFELARGLEVNVGSKVSQNLKLQSGEARISFKEEHTGKDGEPLRVPGAFALRIPLFFNQEPIDIPVRLRYRVHAGSVVWVYKLFRVDRLVAEAVTIAKQDVGEATGLPVYEGAPEMTSTGQIVTAPGASAA
jgi:uncharacterized protein YfdQ (DUF2303 family)